MRLTKTIAVRCGIPLLAGLVASLLVFSDATGAGAESMHTVAPGETLWRIANAHGTTVDALARANQITDARRVFAGKRLVIPDEAEPAGEESEALVVSARPGPAVAAEPEGASEPSEEAVLGESEEKPQPSDDVALGEPGETEEPGEETTASHSWVLGAADVSGTGLGEIRLAALAGSAEAPTPQVLTPSASTRAIDLRRPRDGDDLLQQIEIEQGKSAFLRTDYSIKRVSVGDPEILDVVVLSPRSVQLVARSIGGTNVILWDPQGRPQAAIDVHVGSVRSNLESLLRRVLEGEDIRVESAGAGVALVGSVSNALAMERAVAVSKTFLGEDSEERVVNLLSVRGNQQVMLKVIVAEMNRNLERELGTNFSALIETDGKVISITSLLENLLGVGEGGALVAGGTVSLLAAFSGMGSLSLLAVAMDLVERNGLGKILAEPTLVARSGEMASFLAGGEVPIPIAQGGAFGSITIEYKKFGVGIAFTPTVLGPDRIHLEVAPEVSEPDFTIGTEVDGTRVPGFVTRRASTSVELKDGQSFAIAGLLSDVVRSSAAKYPLLGDIPVLGALFRSTRYQRKETELVIIVTPQLVKPLGPPPHRLPTDSLVDPSALDFYLFGALEARGEAASTAAARVEPTGAGGLIGDAGHRLPADPEEEVW